MEDVKTTLNLPDDLMRQVKIRAAQQDRKLQDLVAELIQRGLSQESAGTEAVQRRVRLPLVQCAHPARPELTADRVAKALLDDDAQDTL